MNLGRTIGCFSRWMLICVCAVTVTVHDLGAARAQNDDGDGAESGATILPVVTLRVANDDVPPEYWWKTPSDPAWTPFDETLRKSLSEHGVRTLEFKQPPRISRIYQRPSLSLQNAAALCSILDVRRLLHGEVVVERHSPGPAYGTGFATATAELQLVDTGARAPTVLQDVSIHRSATASTVETAVEQVQHMVGRAAATVVGRIARTSGGRMSISRREPLIGIWGARKSASLQKLRELMLKADGVETVSLQWAAEGVVGFEINPGTQDSEKKIQYVARVLLEQPLTSITVRKRERPVSGLVSIEVTGEGPSSGTSTP